MRGRGKAHVAGGVDVTRAGGYRADPYLRFAFDLFEGKTLTVAGAAQEYGMSKRTIQRWLIQAEALIPIERLRPDGEGTTYYRRAKR